MEQFLSSDIQQQLINLFQIILGGAISVVSIYAVILVNKYTAIAKEKLQTIQDKNARDKLNIALNRLDALLINTITSTENTLKQEIIKGSEDGTFNKEDLKSLKETVANKVLVQLGTDTKNVLSAEIGDLTEYTNDRLETILANLKDDPNSSVQHTNIK